MSVTPIPQLARYSGDGNPPIVRAFHPEIGWYRVGKGVIACRHRLRVMRAEGITRVAVRVRHPASFEVTTVEFGIKELLAYRP